MTAPAVIAMTTGLLQTTVSPTPSGRFRWVRQCGPLAPRGFNPVAPEVRATLRPAGRGPTGSVRLLVGTGGSRVRAYRTSGVRTVAAHWMEGGDPDGTLGLVEDLGRTLAALHRTPVPDGAGLAGLRGADRLQDWLAGRSRQLWAAQAAASVRDRIGEERWAVLGRDLQEVLADPDRVLSHGAAGFGSLVERTPPEPAGPALGGIGTPDRADGVERAGRRGGAARADRDHGADLLTGEDLALAPWSWDIGCVLAEIIENRWRSAVPAARWQAVLDALTRGYGRQPDERCHRAAVLRIALHVHDYVAYVAADDAQTRRYADLLRTLIDHRTTRTE